jgi:hypothetical protein
MHATGCTQMEVRQPAVGLPIPTRCSEVSAMIVSLEPQLLTTLSALEGAGNADTAQVLDAELATSVRRAALTRRLYYAAVLAVALYGTATGAVTRFGLPWPVAIGGIFALELGGVVFLSNADTRRRLGEPARLSRLLGTAVTGAAATFNLLTHRNALLGGFFALMSVLGFLAWWLDVENKRRDRLRARGQLAGATPSYELWGHWVRHPVLTRRARDLARAYPQLGLHGSLQAAVITMRRERRNAALADALHRRIRVAVSKDMADIAVLTYDMDKVAGRLRDRADYDGLTALLGSELTAERVLHGRDDQAAVAARAWLTDHGAYAPDANTGSHLNHGEPQQLPRSLAAVAGRDTDNSKNIDDARDVGPVRAPVSIGMAHPDPPSARPKEQADRQDAVAGIPAIHLGGPTRITLRVNRTDQPNPAARAMRSSAGAMAHHARLGDQHEHAVGRTGSDPRAVQVRILGTPAILHADGSPARGLRTKSVELLVYLALHRDGSPQADIIAAVWPDVSPERAAQRLSTCLANLRNTIRQIRQAGDSDHSDGEKTHARVDPVINTAGRYRLDSAILAVDWWQTADAFAMAGSIGDNADRRDAIGDPLANLAMVNDYPWLDTGRQNAREDLAQRLAKRSTQ